MYTFQCDLSACSLLIGRAYAEAGSSVKHEEQIKEDKSLKDIEKEAESDSALETSSGEEEDEAGTEGKKKKQRVGFRDRKVINAHALHLNRVMMRPVSSSHYLMNSSGFTMCRRNVDPSYLINMQIHSHEIHLHISELGLTPVGTWQSDNSKVNELQLTLTVGKM